MRLKNVLRFGTNQLFYDHLIILLYQLLESIMLCQSLNIPVIAINAGVSQAEELGLAHFIGPHEYNAGYGAGKRLISRGMKEGYCLSHIEGLGSLKERCR